MPSSHPATITSPPASRPSAITFTPSSVRSGSPRGCRLRPRSERSSEPPVTMTSRRPASRARPLPPCPREARRLAAKAAVGGPDLERPGAVDRDDRVVAGERPDRDRVDGGADVEGLAARFAAGGPDPHRVVVGARDDHVLAGERAERDGRQRRPVTPERLAERLALGGPDPEQSRRRRRRRRPPPRRACRSRLRRPWRRGPGTFRGAGSRVRSRP